MSYAADIAAVKAAFNADVTVKVAAASISPTDVGQNAEDTCDLIADATLDNVCSLGNTSTVAVKVATGLTPPATTYVEVNPEGSFRFTVANGSSYFGKLFSELLTASRGWVLPDEGDGAGIDSTIVLHTTKDPINIGDTTIQHSRRSPSSLQFYDSDGTTINAAIISGVGVGSLLLKDAATAYTGSIKADTLTADRAVKIPNQAGTILVNDAVAVATDAAYVIPSGLTYTELPTITANRNVTLPTGVSGNVIKVVSLNATGFTWTFTGGTVNDAAGAAITVLANQTCYQLEYNGTIWRKIN